jgi:hypothetical protein
MPATLQTAIAVTASTSVRTHFTSWGLDERGAIVLPEVVAWLGRGSVGRHAKMSSRHGGMCRHASSKRQAQRAWSRREWLLPRSIKWVFVRT